MAEEEIATEVDKLVRGIMMAAGQLREHFARRSANKDRATADQARAEAEQAASQFRTQHEATRHLYERAQRPSFWNTADSGTIADLTSYGALNAHLDPTAAELYQLVREKAQERYGVDVNDIRANNPMSEEARNDALRHALDDQRAASRDEAAAAADRDAAATDRGRSPEQVQALGGAEHIAELEQAKAWFAENDPNKVQQWEQSHGFADTVADERADERRLIGDWHAQVDADSEAASVDSQAEAQAESRADLNREQEAGDYEQAHELEQNGDAPGANAVPASTAAGTASRQASVSYPSDAQTTLADAAGQRQPRPSTRGRKRGASRDSELSK